MLHRLFAFRRWRHLYHRMLFHYTVPLIGIFGVGFSILDFAITDRYMPTPINLFIHLIILVPGLMVIRHVLGLDRRVKYDNLTGLINRDHFFDILNMRIQEPGAKVVLIIMDLDRFKYVNDTLGHQIGDNLLTHVAQRFTSLLRESDAIGRLGGDEFGVLLDVNKLGAHDSNEKISMICRRLVDSFDVHVTLKGYNIDVGVSMGIACFPTHAQDLDELVRCADVAMYVAKRGKAGFTFYDSSVDDNTIEALMLGSSIRGAIESDQMVLYYQPQKDLRHNKILSVEALIRWNHPTLGLLPPGKFLPLCDNTLVIREITDWVISEAVRQAKVWRDKGLDIEVAVNISPTDLLATDFVHTIVAALSAENLPYGKIMLEVTEDAVITDMDTAAVVMATLSSMGIKLSVDDYGVGHTSLNYLKHLPITQIKIDRSFITGLVKSSSDFAIVQSTIQLAHDLGYEVVAEGVETKFEYDILMDLDCDIIQGYYVSRPVMAGRIDKSYLARIAELT